jgi:hypothetical protein
MTHLDILVPFCLPPAELAKDLLRELQAPALAMLVSRAKSRRDQSFDAFARALPHESWLAARFGLAIPSDSGSSPPLAAAAMRTFGLAEPAGTWFMLHPVHLHIARDHLVLTDQRQLELADAAARALFESARELFEESGRSLLYGDACNWFVRADDWGELSTATLDAACGRNIDIWMPRGPGERDWRKLQNELQMLWHDHPVNQERETRGLAPVNSVWISGGSPAAPPAVPIRCGQSEALDRFAARQEQPLADWATAAAGLGKPLKILDQLLAPALAGDWGTWLQAMAALEREWFSPLLQALKTGKIDTLSMALTHGTHLSEFHSSKRSVGKFWVKPSLSHLIR